MPGCLEIQPPDSVTTVCHLLAVWRQGLMFQFFISNVYSVRPSISYAVILMNVLWVLFRTIVTFC